MQHLTASTPQGTLVHTLCAWLYPSTCSRSVCCTFSYYVIIGQCVTVCVGQVYVTVQCLLIGCGCHLHISLSPLYCVSLQGIGVSDMLAKCKSIRAFELYLSKGPESLAALSSCLEGVCHSSSIDSLSISCLDAGQWCLALGLLLCGYGLVHVSHGIDC